MERRTPDPAVARAIDRVLAAEREAADAVAAAEREAEGRLAAARERRRLVLDAARQRAMRLHDRAQRRLAAELAALDAGAAPPVGSTTDLAQRAGSAAAAVAGRLVLDGDDAP